MKIYLALILFVIAGLKIHAADEIIRSVGEYGAGDSNELMPEIIVKAKMKVDVLMRQIKSTGECFPKPAATVRFINNRVILEDFKLYKNQDPRFSDGFVAFRQHGKWGACDENGKIILQAKFESSFEFHEGLAGINKDGKYGFINKEGGWDIQPRFDSQYRWHFVGNACAVYIGGKGAIIDKKGDFIWQPGLLRAENLAGGIYIKAPDDQEGFLDDEGRLIPNREPNKRYYKKSE